MADIKMKFNEMLVTRKGRAPLPTAVVHPCSEEALAGAVDLNASGHPNPFQTPLQSNSLTPPFALRWFYHPRYIHKWHYFQSRSFHLWLRMNMHPRQVLLALCSHLALKITYFVMPATVSVMRLPTTLCSKPLLNLKYCKRQAVKSKSLNHKWPGRLLPCR